MKKFIKPLSFIGIDQNFVKDGLIGAGIGIGFILLSLITPAIAIGFPSVPASATGTFKFLVIVIIAPILEELLFRGVLANRTSAFPKPISYAINGFASAQVLWLQVE